MGWQSSKRLATRCFPPKSNYLTEPTACTCFPVMKRQTFAHTPNFVLPDTHHLSLCPQSVCLMCSLLVSYTKLVAENLLIDRCADLQARSSTNTHTFVSQHVGMRCSKGDPRQPCVRCRLQTPGMGVQQARDDFFATMTSR